jgi:uncharacterized protein (DUF1778 family)
MPSYPAKNVTFRTYTVWAEVIEKAAAQAGQTISEYCRDRMTSLAAKDLGIPVPKLPDMKRGRDNELVTRAAALTGLTPEEFMRQASARTAATMLGYEEAEPTLPESPRLSPRATPAPRKRRMG